MRRLQHAAPITCLQWYLAWAFVCLILHLPGVAAADSIIVVKSLEAEPYEEALQGVQAALKRSRRKIDVQEYTLTEGGAGQDKILAEIRKQPPTLILTVGSGATALIHKQVQDVPVVFCMVLNPVASGFVQSMESSGNNLTGASLDIPPRQQFETLKEVVPFLKTVGVLYNPQETGEVVRRAARDAADVGLELLAIPVTTADKLPEILDAHKQKIDALWAVADSTVFASDRATEFLIRRTLAYGLPFMGLSPSFVKAGALLALSASYRNVGAQCGEQVVQVLTGRRPSKIPITVPHRVKLHLNLPVAQTLQVAIPPHIVEGAVVMSTTEGAVILR